MPTTAPSSRNVLSERVEAPGAVHDLVHHLGGMPAGSAIRIARLAMTGRADPSRGSPRKPTASAPPQRGEREANHRPVYTRPLPRRGVHAAAPAKPLPNLRRRVRAVSPRQRPARQRGIARTSARDLADGEKVEDRQGDRTHDGLRMRHVRRMEHHEQQESTVPMAESAIVAPLRLSSRTTRIAAVKHRHQAGDVDDPGRRSSVALPARHVGHGAGPHLHARPVGRARQRVRRTGLSTSSRKAISSARPP